jgi:ProP effector
MTEAEERQQQRRREAKALLEGFWPEVFRYNQPRPLKLGIFAEMVADAERRGLPFDGVSVKAALKAYTSRYAYQRAVSEIAERTGLNGEVAGEVTAEQREYARLQMRRIDDKAAARKKAAKAALQAEKAAKSPVTGSDA